MATSVYHDDKRTITLSDSGSLMIRARGQVRQSYAADLNISDTLPKGTAEAIRKLGESPERWYTIFHQQNGAPFAVMPPATRPAVALAIATAKAEHNRAESVALTLGASDEPTVSSVD